MFVARTELNSFCKLCYTEESIQKTLANSSVAESDAVRAVTAASARCFSPASPPDENTLPRRGILALASNPLYINILCFVRSL